MAQHHVLNSSSVPYCFVCFHVDEFDLSSLFCALDCLPVLCPSYTALIARTLQAGSYLEGHDSAPSSAVRLPENPAQVGIC